MKHKGLVLSTGFALFSMFFGSGNLVFPIQVGQESSGHFFSAAAGILFTGVLIPFLGVFALLLYRGNFQSFFRFFGKKGIFIFSLLSLALMGPFGVLARCITVANGALELIIPNASLPISSAVMCMVIYFLTLNKNNILSILGNFLTPFLLISIGAIAAFGLRTVNFADPIASSSFEALKNGFFQGYQTMDLLAAFFFSAFVLKHLFEKNNEKESIAIFIKAACIGGAILGTVYFSLVLMGWNYASLLNGKPPQEMLGIIALETLGPFAAPVVCLAMIFACLTTAIVLASLFSEFLKTEVLKEKADRKVCLAATLLIGFLVSNLEFSGIAKFLGPILELTYPALIALTVVNIAIKLWTRKKNCEMAL